MKKILTSVAVLALAVLGLNMVAQPTYAADSGYKKVTGWVGDSTNNNGTKGTLVGDNKTDAMGTVQVIINVIIGLVGVIAVVMIIIGGIGFATSQGDPGKVAKGKNTLLFGIVGLVVAILAFAIINFVLTNVFGSTSGEGEGDDNGGMILPIVASIE